MRLIVRSAALLSVGFVLVAVVLGCSSSSGRQVAGVDFIAKNAASVLHGRRLAFSFGTSDIRDIWVLAHGRVVQVSKKMRVATGGSCYGGPYGSGSGPCYEIAEPFSLSPDGEQLAFFLQDTTVAADTTPPALIVSRSDGSQAHKVAASLGICVLCSFSTPSWDRNSRSFVIAVEQFVGTTVDSITKIYRIAIRSGKATMLSPPGTDSYSEDEPAISPDGKEIAFLRNAARGPSSSVTSPPAFVYVMRASGRGRRRLPLPRRAYSSASYWGHNALWWCSSTSLCAGSSANTYRLDLRTGRVTHLRHLAEASYSGLSADGTFAINRRKTRHGWEVAVGPVNAAGVARFAPILAAANAKENPFVEFSVSGP
jgi:hypothetical protein